MMLWLQVMLLTSAYLHPYSICEYNFKFDIQNFNLCLLQYYIMHLFTELTTQVYDDFINHAHLISRQYYGPFILHRNCVAVPICGLYLCRKSPQHHCISSWNKFNFHATSQCHNIAWVCSKVTQRNYGVVWMVFRYVLSFNENGLLWKKYFKTW